jgi:hypothetical protein
MILLKKVIRVVVEINNQWIKKIHQLNYQVGVAINRNHYNHQLISIQIIISNIKMMVKRMILVTR